MRCPAHKHGESSAKVGSTALHRFLWAGTEGRQVWRRLMGFPQRSMENTWAL